MQQSIRTVIRRTGTTIGLLGLPGIAFAGPEDGDVVRGAADIINPNANTTTINQLTDRAVINWQTFNVDADEFVIFNQLDSSSVVLNRVLSSDPSRIFGNISANGQVFLLNPHGIFFGEGATLDVQGFLGSTLDITDDDFMAGDYNFTRADNAAALGTVANAGTITAGEGGYVLLAGDVSENTGLITARGGTAALVSGNALTLDLEGDGLVNFAVSEATLAGEAGVRNAGSIIADGGMVVMTARVANEVTSTVVNNEGTVRARSIGERDGEIWLLGEGGNIEQSGTLDADGENADGGTIFARTDQDMVLHDGGIQTADGDAGHDGGLVRAIAGDDLDYQAGNLISATGSAGGAGGIVEVSGHGGLILAGTPDIGAGGTFIIDPQHIAIQEGTGNPGNFSSPSGAPLNGTYGHIGSTEDITIVGATYIANQLDLGVDVQVVAEESIFVDPGVAVPAGGIALNATGGGNLTFYIGSVSTGNGVSSGTNMPVINPSLDTDAHFIDLSDLSININGNLTINAGTDGSVALGNPGNFANSHNFGNGNVTITGSTVSVGYIETANNVTINGDVTGATFFIGSSSAASNVTNITVNGNINVSGGGSPGVYLNVGSGAINITGNVNASQYVWMLAQGSSSGPGDINVGGSITAGTNIDLDATGANGAAAGGNGTITVGGPVSGGGTVNITAAVGSAFAPTNGGELVLGDVSGNTVNLTTWGDTSYGGPANMSVGDINATGAVTIDGNYGNSYNIGDISGSNVTANFRTNIGGTIGVSLGSISANNNAIVSINQNPDGNSSTGTLDIANITTISGLVNLGVLDNTLNANGLINIANGISAGGDVIINDGIRDKDVIIGAGGVSGDNISIEASGHNLTLGGDINATGSVDLLAGVLAISGQNITANGDVGVFVGNSTGTMSFGDIAGSRIVVSPSGANVVTGSLSASNATGFSEIRINDSFGSYGDITVNGDININAGGVNQNNGIGASLELYTGSAGSNTIIVTGTTTLSVTAGSFSNSDVAGLNGFWGAALINANAGNGGVSMGNINVTGAGEGRVDINAATISLGDISMDIAGGDFNTPPEDPENCNTTGCTGTLDRTITDGGRGVVSLNNDPFINPGATASFGNVNITAPDVEFRTYGQVSVTGGSIALTATGGQYDRVSSGAYTFSGGGSWSLNETLIGAGALLNIETAAGGSVTLGGDVSATGQGYADVQIFADTISVKNVSASVSGGTFTRSGTSNPFASEEDGPFNRDGGSGPRIDEGTINGGTATIQLMNLTSGGSRVAAGSVSAGNLSVNAMGSARVKILAQTVGAGNITGNATLSTRNGTVSDTYSSGGSTFQTSGTVVGSYGDVDVVIENGATVGDVTLGNVSLNGPVAGGHIGGANVTLGDLSFTGTGFNLDVNETHTNVTAGTSETFVFQGEAMISGMGLAADNSLQVGDINISGVGAAGTLLTGANVQTGNVTIDVTDGDVTAQDANFFGGAQTSFTVGNAVFGIDAGTATINGNLDVTAAGVAHIGGTFDVTGDFNVDTGRGYNPVISQQVQFLNSVQEEGGGGNITLPGPMNIAASNISISATTNLDLSTTTLGATGALNLSGAGIMLGTITDGGTSFTANAGNTLDLNSQTIVSGDVTLSAASLSGNGASLDANNVSISTTGAMDLSNAVFTVASNMSLAAGTNIKLTNIAIDTGTLIVDAGGNITNAMPPGVITADALSMTAGGNINLPNITFNIGSGSIAGVNGDATLVNLLQEDELSPTSATPNAYFEGTNVSLGNLNMSGDYLYIVSNSLSVTGFTGANDTLIQLAGTAPGAGIGIEDLPANTSTVNYSNSETFAAFAGQTIAVGSTTSTGDILIGENGTLDIGSTNFFAITRGSVTGLDNVLSTGIVKDLDELLGIGFEIPQTDEIDVNQNQSANLDNEFGYNPGDDLENNLEEDEEGDEEGEDTEDEVVEEQEDDSLISQDTVEEELMCEA